MKRFVKLCTLLLVITLVASLGVTAYASGTVTYNPKANTFIFDPGSRHSPTDLFTDFKNVMPGDTITDQIQIRNGISNRVKVKVYLRSLGAQENTEDFLSQLKLTVEQKGDSILFAAPADETAQLTDWVYLGTVYSGGKITLDLKLEVPITMGNEYQNDIGIIDWQFKIEEFPIEPTDPRLPQTGDASNIIVYSGVMVISLGALILLLIAKRKKDKKS